jgi:RNA polymerase sigma factor (sigma-70 family)
MNADETRVSRGFRGLEAGADSHENPIPPDAAAPVGMSLSDAQLSAFWAGIVANFDAASRIAARFVSNESVEDIVHTAAVLFVEDAQRRSTNPEPFPAHEDRFRRKFLKMVRNHALDCVRDKKRLACPIHSQWGIDPEVVIPARHVADRQLDTIFARNDQGKYDMPAPTVRRPQDDLNGLHYILRSHLEDLSQTQREIIHEAYFEEQPRDEIAERRGISVYTYDNHRKAACQKLRDSMMAVVDLLSDLDLSDWYDRIEEMSKRHAASQRRRASRKKEKRSSSRGDRIDFEGDRSNSRGAADTNARARDESEPVAAES